MLNKKHTGLIPLLAVVAVLVSGCTGKQEPGWEYMPDMYRSPAIMAYESYHIFEDSLSALVPPHGTVPRGFLTYGSFSSSMDGYENAKENLKIPGKVPTDSIALAEGARLYGIYCSPCHGNEGAGQGVLVEREKFLGVPSYADREITEGSVFHVITFGKGMMGSHAAQVSPMERWKITQHVLKLRAELTGGGEEDAETGDQNDNAGADGAEGTEAATQAGNTEENNQG